MFCHVVWISSLKTKPIKTPCLQGHWWSCESTRIVARPKMATSFQGAEGSTEDLTHYVTGSYHFDPSRSGVIDCFAAMFCYVLLCFAMFCYVLLHDVQCFLSFEIKTATRSGSIAGRFAGRTTKTSNQLRHRVSGSRCSHLCGMMCL